MSAPSIRQILVATNENPTHFVSDALHSGEFLIVGSCLRLRIAGATWTPIFVPPARIETGQSPELVLGERRFALGRPLRVGGAETALESAGVRISPQIERACGGPYFLVADVGLP